MRKQAKSFTMDDEVMKKLKNYSTKKGISMSFCVNKVMENFLDSPDSKKMKFDVPLTKINLGNDSYSRSIKACLNETFPINNG